LTKPQEDDPTNGFVDYTGLPLAKQLGLTKIVDKKVFLGVDNTNIVPQGSRGRRSLWLTSKIEFTHGLLIGDFAHACIGLRNLACFLD
jgi:hypothetical protein